MPHTRACAQHHHLPHQAPLLDYLGHHSYASTSASSTTLLPARSILRTQTLATTGSGSTVSQTIIWPSDGCAVAGVSAAGVDQSLRPSREQLAETDDGEEQDEDEEKAPPCLKQKTMQTNTIQLNSIKSS